MKKLAAFCLLTVLAPFACAEPPQAAVPVRPACVATPPPAVGEHRLRIYTTKTLDEEHGIAALILDMGSFVEFSDWIIDLAAWADKTYAACKDPKAPAAPPVFPKLRPSQK